MSKFDYENNNVIKGFKNLDKGGELWPALDVMTLFGYENTQEFKELVIKAKEICDMKGVDSSKHFIGNINSLQKLELTKYSSFLISIFADLNKTEVTYSKMFFEIEIKNMYV